MAKKLYITTPFCPVLAAYTTRPDKPYEATNKDGKPNPDQYKIALDPTAEQAAKFQADVKALVAGHNFKVRAPKYGVSKAEADGAITIRPASVYKPTIYDAKKGELVDPKIGKDSVARAYCELNPHDKGVGLRLISVQIKELVEWVSTGGGSQGFDEVDGYEGSGAEGFNDEGSETTSEETSALDI